MQKNILCFGDSNTWGLDPTTGQRFSSSIRWTGVLQQQLGLNFNIIEAGEPNRTLVRHPPFSGEKTGLSYLQPYLQEQPIAAIVIMLGTNDLKCKFNYSAMQIGDGLAQLIRAIEHFYQQNVCFFPAKLIVLSPLNIKPMANYQRIFTGYNNKINQLHSVFAGVVKHAQHVYVDLDKQLTVSDIDGIHLDSKGHLLLAKQLGEIIKYYIG